MQVSSAANKRFTSLIHLLYNYKPFNQEIKITSANGGEALGIGDLNIISLINGVECLYVLKMYHAQS